MKERRNLFLIFALKKQIWIARFFFSYLLHFSSQKKKKEKNPCGCNPSLTFISSNSHQFLFAALYPTTRVISTCHPIEVKNNNEMINTSSWHAQTRTGLFCFETGKTAQVLQFGFVEGLWLGKMGDPSNVANTNQLTSSMAMWGDFSLSLFFFFAGECLVT